MSEKKIVHRQPEASPNVIEHSMLSWCIFDVKEDSEKKYC